MVKKIAKVIGAVVANFIVFLLFFVLLGFLAVAASETTSAAGALSWITGLLVGFLWLVGVATLCFLMWRAPQPDAPRWLRTHFRFHRKPEGGLAEQHPVGAQLALIAVAILTAIFTLTAMSRILEEQGWAEYTRHRNDLPMRELLFRFYLWHVVDMIPVLDLSKVYDYKPSIEAKNFLAKTMVLVFRTAILSFAIASVVSMIKSRRTKSEVPASTMASDGKAP